MPRYYFETGDQGVLHQDDEGIDLAGPQAARREALAALPDMARDEIPGGDTHIFQSLVRDETGDIVFEGTLTLKGTWHKRT